jgi:two-component system, sensor histidine kinase and response regulator
MSESLPCVLAVDDTPANLVALSALLDGLDCELVAVESGNEALRQLLRREFAVMLLDVQMPDMDGYEVARHARENPATRDVPIIFLTAGRRTDEGVLRGYGSGAVDFLFKPLDAHVLRSKVRVFLELYLSRKRLSDTLSELERANEALRHFTSAASHDLREPARTIHGYMQALLEDAGDGLEPTLLRYVNRSHAASGRMLSLLDSLLVYARLRKPPAPVEVDCRALVDQVCADLSALIARRGAKIEIGALPHVRADADRLYQLFLNLVANAIKFTAPGKCARAEITARTMDNQVVFCVEDDGIGIPHEQKDQVFEAFRRLRGREEYEGSGLGLTICRQVVEQHGGRIWVESEPGRGSRFLFSIANDRPS